MLFAIHATLPAPAPLSDMQEMLVSSEEFYSEIGERDRHVIEIDLFEDDEYRDYKPTEPTPHDPYGNRRV